MKPRPPAETGRRLARDRSVRASLFAFTLSRLIVLVIFVMVGVMTTAPDAAPGHIDTHISVTHLSFARIMQQQVATADVNWYLGIAEHGYEQMPFNADVPRHWAFFPLFPLLWRFAAQVTGEFVLTGMALSHLLFLPALFLLHRVCMQFGLSADDADRGVFYLAVFPTSYFFRCRCPSRCFYC